MNSREIFTSFSGQSCPGCLGWKEKRMAFCVGCYSNLPKHMQKALFRRFGSGFEEAHEAALNWLLADRADTDRLLEGA